MTTETTYYAVTRAEIEAAIVAWRTATEVRPLIQFLCERWHLDDQGVTKK
jgi:hypothetical protein